jgi:hypothetical protein
MSGLNYMEDLQSGSPMPNLGPLALELVAFPETKVVGELLQAVMLKGHLWFQRSELAQAMLGGRSYKAVFGLQVSKGVECGGPERRGLSGSRKPLVASVPSRL